MYLLLQLKTIEEIMALHIWQMYCRKANNEIELPPNPWTTVIESLKSSANDLLEWMNELPHALI